jgi:inosose dehydratase
VIRVANAPVSYGAFELTVGVSPSVPGPEEVLEAIAEAGYEGTELGPPGYLGDAETLPRRLERHGLALVGAYIPVRFSEPERRDADLTAIAATLDLLEAAGGGARPVLADAGSDARRASPGGGAEGLDEAGWRRLIEGVNRATELVRGRSFEPVFHHHAGTFVETPAEIERLLEATEIGLLLDTGHLALAGADPLGELRRWGARVGHVHVKNVRRNLLERALADGADMPELWRRGIFCELGEGDVDVEAFVAELRASGYDGWLVIEQDRIPAPDAQPREAAAAQARNRRWLAERTGL